MRSINLRIVHDNDLPAFGGFFRPQEPATEASGSKDDPLYIALNVEANLCDDVIEDEKGNDVVLTSEERRVQLVATLMHEFGHALEYLLHLPANEDVIDQATNEWALQRLKALEREATK